VGESSSAESPGKRSRLDGMESYSTVQYSTVLHSTVQYSAVQNNTTLLLTHIREL